MGKPLVLRKVNKAEDILNSMTDMYCEEEFKELFKKMYPDDWKRINRKYLKETVNVKAEKEYPMPEPEVYLHNMYQMVMGEIKKRTSDEKN